MSVSDTPQADVVLARLLVALANNPSGVSREVAIHREGGERNPAVTPFGLVISQSCREAFGTFFSSGEQRLSALAIAAHAQAHFEFSPLFNRMGRLKDLSLAVISLIEDARVEARMGLVVPKLSEVFARFLDPQKAKTIVGVEGQLAQIAVCLHLRTDPFENLLCKKVLSMMELVWRMPSILLLDQRRAFDAVREIGSVIANDLGQLRYRFDRSRYNVWPPYRDDNSGLWSDEKAEDLIHETVSQGKATDYSESSTPGLDADRDLLFFYDEWDSSENRYKAGYATVKHRGVHVTRMGAEIRQRFSSLITADAPWTKALRGHRFSFSDSGDNLDLDRTVERSIDVVSGVASNDRIYRIWRRRKFRAGILFLLDASQSANDRISGTFLSVLDVQKRALISLADRFSADAIPFGIFSFNSNTQDDVRVIAHKGFLTLWSDNERQSLKNLQAELSTRMGAALRHSGAICNGVLQQLAVVVITDGEPTDIDPRAPEYFDVDTHRAVQELRQSGAEVLCLKIGEDLRGRSAMIFGQSNLFCVNPKAVSPGLLQLFRKLRKSFV